MPTIDLTEAQTYFTEQLRVVSERLGGAANHVVFPDLTAPERSSVVTLRNKYDEFRKVLERLLADVAALVELGHPVLPTLSVPASMIASVNREDVENDAFRACFVPEPVASRLGKELFGSPEAKSLPSA